MGPTGILQLGSACRSALGYSIQIYRQAIALVYAPGTLTFTDSCRTSRASRSATRSTRLMLRTKPEHVSRPARQPLTPTTSPKDVSHSVPRQKSTTETPLLIAALNAVPSSHPFSPTTAPRPASTNVPVTHSEPLSPESAKPHSTAPPPTLPTITPNSASQSAHSLKRVTLKQCQRDA
jgi:hypothetical protein